MNQLKVGDQVRLIPDFPSAAPPLRWQTIRSLSPSFVQLDSDPGALRLAGSMALVSRRVLEEYIAAGRIEVREPEPDTSWLLAQAAAAMVGLGFRNLIDTERAS